MLSIVPISIFTILIISIIPTRSRPQNDKISLNISGNNNFETKRVLLPPPPNSAAFFRHPNARKILEYGSHFEGDIVLTSEQEKFYKKDSKYIEDTGGDEDGGLLTRSGRISTSFRWPKDYNGNVIVPYIIDDTSKFSYFEKIMIRVSMDYISLYTCVIFVNQTNQNDYIFIKSGNGCHSYIGKVGGSQEISLEKGGCFIRGIILHELIHALGYHHMHNREDRDQYITINWQNIIFGMAENFDKVNSKFFSNFNTSYDYNSVMHYGSNTFSRNSIETITAKDQRYQKKIGQRKGLTQGDVDRINNMYNCYRK
ncbi:hypothetical protein PVAND_016386 [Polypedilum vanderplanki]|uniref:Metalloendopeptidase n=1 Tax=Polypedilum vanderplanki TaxID=319348 RepID=A0A9J6BG41_POLVA|nr:hypothetical protein PVAND_016386 [Polypedilum vanderplanki]